MSTNDWNNKFKYHDSGSESTPLLSSGSHTSHGSIMFHYSETSDTDVNLSTCDSRHENIEATSFNSTVTILSQRWLSHGQRNTTGEKEQSTKTHCCSSSVCENHGQKNIYGQKKQTTDMHCSLDFIHDKHYQIHAFDLNRNSGKHEVNDAQLLSNEFHQGFLSTTLIVQETNCVQSKPKQSSLITIFSIWNTMLGSSLLTMAWGIEMAGFFPGIILVLLIGALCLYTAYCLLVVQKYYGGHDGIEVIQLCRISVNKWLEYVAKVFSISVLLGAIIAYWILMSNFLYNSVNFIYDNIMGLSAHNNIGNDSYASTVLCLKKEVRDNSTIVITIPEVSFNILGPVWSLHKTVPTFLAIIMFPLLNFNSTTFFTKFNSLGTASVLYLITFVIIKSASWGINMDEATWKISWILKPTFPALSGMLSLSFFIHNIIITIMQNNRDQSKNGRDLTIAYILVTLTYIIVGVVFFISFPLPKSCIEDNLLDNFEGRDTLTLSARIVLLFQLLTVYPLLAYMLRIQLHSFILKKNPAFYWTFITNFVLVSICVLFATFMPYIGTIIRYSGALSGFIYIFTLPSVLYLIILHKQGKLTIGYFILHLIIPLIGALNLIAQFFITDH